MELSVDEMIKYLKALVILQAQVVANIEGAIKPEILLSLAGLSHKEIAVIVGKSKVAVSKALSRANPRKEQNDG
jgi:hypothetical protein